MKRMRLEAKTKYETDIDCVLCGRAIIKDGYSRTPLYYLSDITGGPLCCGCKGAVESPVWNNETAHF